MKDPPQSVMSIRGRTMLVLDVIVGYGPNGHGHYKVARRGPGNTIELEFVPPRPVKKTCTSGHPK